MADISVTGFTADPTVLYPGTTSNVTMTVSNAGASAITVRPVAVPTVVGHASVFGSVSPKSASVAASGTQMFQFSVVVFGPESSQVGITADCYCSDGTIVQPSTTLYLECRALNADMPSDGELYFDSNRNSQLIPAAIL